MAGVTEIEQNLDDVKFGITWAIQAASIGRNGLGTPHDGWTKAPGTKRIARLHHEGRRNR
jgi:hypothetical protein